jgi:hypothetical protein
MVVGIWNLEWLNSNSQRSYPLTETASKVDTTGTFTIPDSLLLGLYFPIHAGLVAFPERFYIRSISVFSTGLSLVLGYWDSDEGISVATVTVAFSSHSEYKTYSLVGEGDFIDCVGKIVLGRVDELNTLPAGAYNFSYESSNVDSDAIRLMIRGVSSISLVNGTSVSKRLQGDIAFVAGTNMQLYSSTVDGVTSITFNAIKGEGLSLNCNCEDDLAIGGCVRSVNGTSPNETGDIAIIGDDCLNVVSISNGLQFNDTCSKPCCGCTELEAVTTDLVRFGDAANSLTNFLNRLEGSVNRMNLTVLGSRVGDGGSCLG